MAASVSVHVRIDDWAGTGTGPTVLSAASAVLRERLQGAGPAATVQLDFDGTAVTASAGHVESSEGTDPQLAALLRHATGGVTFDGPLPSLWEVCRRLLGLRQGPQTVLSSMRLLAGSGPAAIAASGPVLVATMAPWVAFGPADDLVSRVIGASSKLAGPLPTIADDAARTELLVDGTLSSARTSATLATHDAAWQAVSWTAVLDAARTDNEWTRDFTWWADERVLAAAVLARYQAMVTRHGDPAARWREAVADATIGGEAARWWARRFGLGGRPDWIVEVDPMTVEDTDDCMCGSGTTYASCCAGAVDSAWFTGDGTPLLDVPDTTAG